TQRLDAPTNRLDDGGQTIATQVRPGVVQHRWLAFAFGEELQHAPHVRAAATVGELAVAEGAGTALAEEIIALRIVRPARIKGAHVTDAIAHRPAALQHQRPIALFREKVRCRQSTRTGADDDGSLPQRHRTGRWHLERRLFMKIDAYTGR